MSELDGLLDHLTIDPTEVRAQLPGVSSRGLWMKNTRGQCPFHAKSCLLNRDLEFDEIHVPSFRDVLSMFTCRFLHQDGSTSVFLTVHQAKTLTESSEYLEHIRSKYVEQ